MPKPPDQPDGIALREAINLVQQFKFVRDTVIESLAARFRLSSHLLLGLHRIAMDGLDVEAGSLRTGRVFITNAEHKPPPATDSAELVNEMCDYVNANWGSADPVHLAAYVMWRVNWIHPFSDGNGRTSRAASYLVLCTALGYLLPGSITTPEQIARNKRRYFEVLEDCDAAWRGGRLDVSPMERLIARYLEGQLESAPRGDSGAPD